MKRARAHARTRARAFCRPVTGRLQADAAVLVLKVAKVALRNEVEDPDGARDAANHPAEHGLVHAKREADAVAIEAVVNLARAARKGRGRARMRRQQQGRGRKSVGHAAGCGRTCVSWAALRHAATRACAPQVGTALSTWDSSRDVRRRSFAPPPPRSLARAYVPTGEAVMLC